MSAEKAVTKYGASRKPWKEAAREEQQRYYEVFGDRDWDLYKEVEEEYLERNLGHAMFGPPDELPDKDKNHCTGIAWEWLVLWHVLRHGTKNITSV
jgi:hypothetical protein